MLLKQLQYFMAVAECRHFTRSADRLFVSQSALFAAPYHIEEYNFDLCSLEEEEFMSECASSGFVPQVVSKCNGPGRRIDLVAAGLGITLISSSGLSYYTAAKISILHLARPFYKRIVLARAKRDSYPPPLAALWNHILHCDKKRRAAHP